MEALKHMADERTQSESSYAILQRRCREVMGSGIELENEMLLNEAKYLGISEPQAEGIIRWARKHAEEAPAEAQPEEVIGFLDASHFLAETAPEAEWIIPGLIQKFGLGVLAGVPGGGKTWSAIRIAKDGAERGFRVGIIEDEGSKRGFQNRLRAAGCHNIQGGGAVYVLFQKGFRLDSTKWLESVKAQAKALQLDLLILDPLANLHGFEEKDQKQMAALWTAIADLHISVGCALLVTHHTTKTAWAADMKPALSDIRGSGVIAGRVDFALILKPLAEQGGDEETAPQDLHRVELHVVKQRDAEAQPPRMGELRKVQLEDGGRSAVFDWSDVSPAKAKRDSRIERAKGRVLEVLARVHCESSNDVVKALRGAGAPRREDALEAVRQMLASGELDRLGKQLVPSGSQGGSKPSRNSESGGSNASGGPFRAQPLGTTPISSRETGSDDEEIVPVVPSGSKLLCLKCGTNEQQDGRAWCGFCWDELRQP